MLFPTGAETPKASTGPQSRNAQMAALLSALIESPEQTRSLLREARTLLLAPFEGVPEDGSIYGDAASTLDERVARYEAAMSDRVAKARRSGSLAQSAALESMLDFVLDELGFEREATDDEEESGGAEGVAAKLAAAMASDEAAAEELMRLRGGGARGGGSFLDDPAVRRNVDSVLRATEAGASELRRSLRPLLRQPTATDATAAGACVGYATGKIFFGDPKLLALCGACAFAYAHTYPEKTDARLLSVASRCSELMHEARAHLSGQE